MLRSHDEEPWVPLSFGQFGDGMPYIYLSGRVTPRLRSKDRSWSGFEHMNVTT